MKSTQYSRWKSSLELAELQLHFGRALVAVPFLFVGECLELFDVMITHTGDDGSNIHNAKLPE